MEYGRKEVYFPVMFFSIPQVSMFPMKTAANDQVGVFATKIAFNALLTGAGVTSYYLISFLLFFAAVKLAKPTFIRLSKYNGLKRNMK